jgi:hypothetical protein
MARDAVSQDLLYVTSLGTDDVYVYSYPQGHLQGRLTGFYQPLGECVDKAGDVFIANTLAGNIREYAHGGTSPIATLSDPDYPGACAVDPTTGNLAVTNANSPTANSFVSIYKGAKGHPKGHYMDPHISVMYNCGYDDSGNLFVDGVTSGSAFRFAELPRGMNSFRNITLNESISWPGGVQWDGKYIAVGDYDGAVVHQFTIHGTKGKKVGSTSFGSGAQYVEGFWIQGSTIVAPDNFIISGSKGYSNVLLYKYPAGGNATKVINERRRVSPVYGSVVSLAH